MSPIVALDQVEVDYPNRGRALGPVSFSVAAGEIIALVGPSGSGKSTALRLLAGLEGPSRGVLSRDLGRGKTSVVFQAPTLAPWLSAQANVALPLELSGVSKSEAFAQAGAAKLMPESTLNATTLVEAVMTVFTDKEVAGAMQTAAKKLAVRDSALKIAKIVEEA